VTFSAHRDTGETTVNVDLDPVPTVEDAEGVTVRLDWDAHGGIDERVDPAGAKHLFEALFRYARLDGTLEATGDLAHHVLEDAAITTGTALAPATSEPIQRFADRTVPMDETLVQAVLDVGGRPHVESDLDEVSPLFDHVLATLAKNANATLHVRVIRKGLRHHAIEASVKATGLALRDALLPSDRIESTKGRVDWDEPRDVA